MVVLQKVCSHSSHVHMILIPEYYLHITRIWKRFYNQFEDFYFLGGLSLHLNQLIQSRIEISYWLFGTLPIGLLLSNLDSRQLETSPMTSYDQF